MKLLKQTILLTFPLSIILTGLSVLLTVEVAYAADPGCYVYYGSAEGTSYTRSECATEEQARSIVAPLNQCFVAPVSSQGVGSFTQRDCDSFTEGSSTGDAPARDIGGRESLASDDPAANCEPENGEPLSSENCKIIGIIVDAINILSGLAGLAIVASLVIAGYQYMTARDNAGQIQKAKTRIIWALSALALFIFMYAILNFLVPGGVL